MSLSPLSLLLLLSPLLTTAYIFNDDDPLIQQVTSRDNHENLFTEFKTKYNKSYANQDEDDYRFGVFVTNLRLAKRNQELDPTAVHGVNKFSDLTVSEFGSRFAGSRSEVGVRLPEYCKKAENLSLDGLPEYWNWTEYNIVTRVKDQTNDCNACWAFATIAVLEAAHARANNELVELSEQQLIDCSDTCKGNDPKECNRGCKRGYRHLGFKYLKEEGGVVKAEEYPFQHENGNCHINKDHFAASVDDYNCIHEEALYRPHLVKNGPISVNINLTECLKDYTGGIHCYRGEGEAHAVTVVGYNFENKDGEQSYFIVKNSWGENWGENGYFKVCRGIIQEKELGIIANATKTNTTLTN